MNFIIDGILVVACVIIIVTSAKRGFVKTVLSLVSSIAAFLVAVTFSPALADMINAKFILPAISGNIEGTVSSLTDGTSEGLAELFTKMPDTLREILTRYGLGDSAVSDIAASAASGESGIADVSGKIASPVATAISYAVAFLLLFVAAIIVLKLLVFIIDKIFKLPGLKTVNTLAGIVLGVIISVIFIFAYSFVAAKLTVALGSLSPNLFGQDTLDSTVIVKFFSEHNIVSVIESVTGR